MNEKQKTYLVNLFTSYIPFLIQIIGSIIFTPLFIKVIGQEQYSLFILINTVVSYFSLCDAGLSQALSFKLVGYIQHNEKQKINTLVSSIFYYYLIAAILINVCVVLLLFSNLFTTFGVWHHDQHLIFLFKIGLATLSLSFTATIISQIFEKILFANDEIYKINLIKTVQQLCIILVNIVLIVYWGRLELIFLNHLIFNLFGALVLYLVSKRAVSFEIMYRLYSKKIFYSIAKPSWWYFVGSFSCLLIFQTDVFVISRFHTLKAVALYTIYFKFIDMFRIVLTKAVDIKQPRITSYFSKKDFASIRQLYLLLLVFISLCAVAVIPFLLIPGYKILQWWIGESIVNDYALYFPFVIYFVLYSIDHVSSVFLAAMCIHRNVVIMGLLNGVVNLGLSIGLSYYMGLKGVIWGSIIALIVTNLWYNIYYLSCSLKAFQREPLSYESIAV